MFNTTISKLNILKHAILESGITTVYMDADGCLVDWEGYMAKRIHRLSDMFSIKDYRSNIPILNGMDKLERKVLVEQYYQVFPDTFANLDITTDFYELCGLMHWLKSKGIIVKILTSLDDKHHDLARASLDKIKNISNHLDQIGLSIPIEVVTTHSDKAAYATVSSLIIDDYHRNVTNFIEAGGMGICHVSGESTIEEFINMVGYNK